MVKRTSDSVVVITGASSGIGRAAAEAFSRGKGSVVLAARREKALHEVARRCQDLGGCTLVVRTDVTDPQAVEELARRTLETFGRIDVWVNNAAVSLFGRFEETPAEDVRRVLDTNILGYMNGARHALQAFREQGSGVLINVSSVVSSAAQPYTSAYVASKAAIRELSACLRMELLLDGKHDIHVCTVLPASIDTPIFQQAGNYTGRQIQALEPVNPATMVADAIVEVAQRPRRECVVGRGGATLLAFSKHMPALYERVGARRIDRHHLGQEHAESGPGNLFEPMQRHASISGGWLERGRVRRRRERSWVVGLSALLLLAPLAWLLATTGPTDRRRVLRDGARPAHPPGRRVRFALAPASSDGSGSFRRRQPLARSRHGWPAHGG